MRHAFPVLDAARTTEAHAVPMGVALGPCDLCGFAIVDVHDALVYKRKESEDSMLVHDKCASADIARRLQVIAKHGIGAFAGLR